MTNPKTPKLAVLYRWKIKPGSEDQFTASWSRVTQSLLERGSLGSRLHKGDDDTWYAYAQWPSNAAREKAFAATSDSPDQAKMREAILESFPPVHLEPIADFLLPTGTAPKAFDGEYSYRLPHLRHSIRASDFALRNMWTGNGLTLQDNSFPSLLATLNEPN